MGDLKIQICTAAVLLTLPYMTYNRYDISGVSSYVLF